MSHAWGALLAVCGGGGNDTLALLVLIAIVLAYLLVLRVPLAGAEDGAERLLLIGVLIASIVIGALVFGDPIGLFGGGAYLTRFIVSLPIAGGLGLGLAAATERMSAGRALAIAIVGDILIPGGLIVLLFTSVGIGTGCLD